MGTNPSAEIIANGGIALPDNGKATFGAGDDLQIYHDGSHSYIDDVGGTGNLKVRATNLVLQSAIDKNYATFVANGAASLFYDNSEKLATTATGIDVTGTVVADGLTVTTASTANLGTYNYSSVDRAKIEGQQVGGAGGKLDFQTNTGAGLISRMNIDHIGNISFYEDTGTTAQMVWDASADALNFGDNVKATFGAGDDLQLYHNGNNSFIEDVGTGNLYLRAANNIFIEGATANESMATFQENGFVKLFFNNEEKLATTSTGIDVTGTATMGGLDISSNGNDSFTQTHTDGNTVIFTQAGTGGDVQWRNANGGALINTAATNRALFDSNGDVSFYEDTGTTPKFFWDASAESLGIGTSSPAELVHAADTSTGGAVGFRAENSEGHVNLLTNGGGLQIETSASGTVATIDSSGNLLVGTTTTPNGSTDGTVIFASGTVASYRTGAAPAVFSRNASNGGDVVVIQQQGTTVGSIGAKNNGLYMGTTNGADECYIRFAYNGDRLVPASATGGTNDAALDLGDPDSRFKDLYLSGGVYQNGTRLTKRTSPSSVGSGIFASITNAPQTGFVHIYETGTDKYLILACFKKDTSSIPVTNVVANNGLTVNATNAGGTIAIGGHTSSGNVKMQATIIREG